MVFGDFLKREVLGDGGFVERVVHAVAEGAAGVDGVSPRIYKFMTARLLNP